MRINIYDKNCTGQPRAARLRTRLLAAIVITTTMFLAAGCAEKKPVSWTPLPTVQWEAVSSPVIQPVRDGYRIVVPQPTAGLFPAAMGVTRVAVMVREDGSMTTEPYLLTNPRNEFLQWNSALDDQMAVSEVFPVVTRDLGGGRAIPEQILAANRALHSRLGLIYAVNERSRSETEMFGAIYDTKTSAMIASLHAEAISTPQPGNGAAPPTTSDKHPNPWETDSRALVRERFEQILRACIRDLILHDEGQPVEAPTGWTPAGPIRPVEWPPR